MKHVVCPIWAALRVVTTVTVCDRLRNFLSLCYCNAKLPVALYVNSPVTMAKIHRGVYSCDHRSKLWPAFFTSRPWPAFFTSQPRAKLAAGWS